jgi:hypothetical protein
MATYRDKFPLPWVPRWVPGRWYPPTFSGTLSTGAIGATTMYAVPIFVPNPEGVVATSIGIEVTLAGTSGHVMRLSIYDHDPVGQPGGLILDAGTVGVDPVSVPSFQSISISQFLRQGWYWLAVTTQSGTFRVYLSGNHLTFLSRVDEGGSANNPQGISYSPSVASVITLYTLTGHPPQFPHAARPIHSTYPRIMLGI